jgi:hypothetical protein
MIARFQEQDVYSVRYCSVYFEPFDRQGERTGMYDEKGKPLEVLEINPPKNAAWNTIGHFVLVRIFHFMLLIKMVILIMRGGL